MHNRLLTITLATALAALTGSAFAGATEQSLLGKDPGKAPAYACFSRQYDAAHLASHPKQNTTRMSLLVNSTYDTDPDPVTGATIGRQYTLELGIGFRKLKGQFEVSGNCSTTVDGKQLLTCGVDCDGGSFDISTVGKSVMIAIPDGVKIWDPNATDEAGNDLPKGAEFGSDDKLFKLDPVDIKECNSLMTDEARTAIYGK